MEKLINQYLEEMAALKSESTVKNHRSSINKFFKMVSVNEPVEVLPQDVMDFKKKLLAAGTVGSMNTQLKRVKAFFGWCISKGMIEMNPADDIKLVAEAEAAPKWLTKEQKGALLRAINRDYLGINVPEERKSYKELLMVLLMMKSGLRIGEVCGLKWKDVSFSDRKGEMIIRSNKTEQHRTVGITSDTLKVMKQYVEKHGKQGEYVFYSRQSDRINERTVQNMLARYKGLKTEVAEIGLITAHMLRHTFGHDLVNGGMQIEAVARLMGHIKKNGQPNIQQTIMYTKQSTTEIIDDMERILAIG